MQVDGVHPIFVSAKGGDIDKSLRFETKDGTSAAEWVQA